MFHVLCCDTSGDTAAVSWTVFENGAGNDCDNQNHSLSDCVVTDYAHTSYSFFRRRRLSEYFAPAVEHVRMLAGGSYDELTCVCCVCGPGSFTGLRNAFAFIKGLMAVHGNTMRAVAVRTHDALAHGYTDAKSLHGSCGAMLVLTTAAGGRYYAAVYPVSSRENMFTNTTRVQIHDSTLEDIARSIASYKRVLCVNHALDGPAADVFEQLRTTTDTDVVMPTRWHCDMLRAVRDVGLAHYARGECFITEESQPLYIHPEV